MFFAGNIRLFTGPNLGHIHLGNKAKGCFRDGVDKLQLFGAKLLIGEPLGESGGGLREILGITQNGKAHMGTMDPELVGSAGNGPQGQLGTME